jgi:hypothetical protein
LIARGPDNREDGGIPVWVGVILNTTLQQSLDIVHLDTQAAAGQ